MSRSPPFAAVYGRRARTRKRPSSAPALEAAAEQLRPLAHADEAVPVGLSSLRRRVRVGDRELERVPGERHLDVRAAAPVAGCVGQRLLEDSVRRPVDGGREVPAIAVELDDDGEPGGAVALGEGLERGETRAAARSRSRSRSRPRAELGRAGRSRPASRVRPPRSSRARPSLAVGSAPAAAVPLRPGRGSR